MVRPWREIRWVLVFTLIFYQFQNFLGECFIILEHGLMAIFTR